MFVSLVIGLAANIAPLLTVRLATDECWSIDKTTVHSGGCVTIILEKPCSELPGLLLQIDDQKPVELIGGAGPDFHGISKLTGRDQTLVLVYRDYSDREAFEESLEEPGVFRAIPLFNLPGPVRLSLHAGGERLGTRTVTVVPYPPEAREALRLLNPRLGTKERAFPNEVLWSQVIVSRTLGTNPRVTEDQLQWLRETLPTIKKHPDWAEILEMRVAEVGATFYAMELADLANVDPGAASRAAVERPLPDFVQQALGNDVTSPFAQAVQNSIRDTLSMRMRYVPRGTSLPK